MNKVRFFTALLALYKMLEEKGKENLVEYIAAQWCLESNWGTSNLAKEFNNFGGMKYRKELAEYGSPSGYVDWAGEESDYFKLEKPEDYCRLYWAFIHRSPYPSIEAHMEDGAEFIFYLASCGYVSTETPQSYLDKIERIRSTQKFANLMYDIIKPEWV